jgi:diguanylate cyclase (GGDEF)-like protein
VTDLDALRRIVPASVAAEELREKLVSGWTTLSSAEAVLRELAGALAGTDLALERLSLAMCPTLAALDGIQHVWERERADEIRTLLRPPGFLDDPEHLASPLHVVLTGGTRLRERLCAGEGTARFPFLAELARTGHTDYLEVPLPGRRPTFHVLSAATRRPDGWTESSLQAIDRLLPVLGMLAEVWECERLLDTATTDALTRIASRRAFEAALRQAWSTCARAASPISLVCFDIDYFKRFNDTYGHPAGDRCLMRVAAAASGCVQRGGDLVARLGGEEFALLLPASSAEGARVVAERVRAAVAALAIPHAGSWAAPHVTVSVGTATLMPKERGTRTRLLELADTALYRAKQHGRDRVESA